MPAPNGFHAWYAHTYYCIIISVFILLHLHFPICKVHFILGVLCLALASPKGLEEDILREALLTLETKVV